MNTVPWGLFAQRNRLDSFSDSFRNRPGASGGDLLLGLLVVTALLAAGWALSRLLTLRQRRGSYDSPGRLFASLCKAHRLGWSERRLLGRLAQVQQLKEPARLFLEPERFEESRLTPGLRDQAARLTAIRQRLFQAAAAKQPVAAKQEEPRARPPAPAAVAGRFPSVPVPTLDIPPWTSGSSKR